MNYENITFKIDNGVAILTLNRPDKLNSFTQAMHLEVRSALEAVCYQTRDLMTAMAADAGGIASRLRVDGGMVRNDWVMQFLADILGLSAVPPAPVRVIRHVTGRPGCALR